MVAYEAKPQTETITIVPYIDAEGKSLPRQLAYICRFTTWCFDVRVALRLASCCIFLNLQATPLHRGERPAPDSEQRKRDSGEAGRVYHACREYGE